jgi:dihydrofolate reductase
LAGESGQGGGGATAPRIILYIAASVDGYIATPDGSYSWLDPFEAGNYGYQEFIAGIDTVVIGRTTFDQMVELDAFPYSDKRTVVLTHRPPGEGAPVDAEFSSGPVEALAGELRSASRGDIWLGGGGETVRAFLEADEVDEMWIFVIPVLLGDGIPLFPPSQHGERLSLEEAKAYPDGVVLLRYTPSK